MRSLFVVLGLLAITAAAASAAPLENAKDSVFYKDPENYSFDTYVAEFGKSYDDIADYVIHEFQFAQNMEQIKTINAAHKAGQKTWHAGVNKFTDMSKEEFSRFKGRRPVGIPTTLASTQLDAFYGQALPASVDWRTKNVTTPVKDQGGCGSCWAFSTTAVLESHAALNSKKLLVLAPQQLVDCAPNPDQCGGTGGCNGSTQELGFNYTSTAGLTTEQNYPYEGVTNSCNTAAASKPAVGNAGYIQLGANNYTQLMTAVANLGPIAISVAADAFMFYSGGIFSQDCGWIVDHAVVADGYGVENGQGFWLVRNSWGSSWGEAGYIRIARELNAADVKCGTDTNPSNGDGCAGGPSSIPVCGECAIYSDSSYPTGAHVL